MALPKYFEAIENHLDDYFDNDDEIVVFDEKESKDFHLDVYWIKPNFKRNYSILLTNGISSCPLKTPDSKFSPYIELAILLPEELKLSNDLWKLPENNWPISLIKKIGRYPSQNNTWLGFGHTIPQPINEPIYRTEFIATLLLKSKTLPEQFQKIKYGENIIDVYLLFPLYYEELEYKKNNGTNMLIDKFIENEIDDIIDINRKNVCK